MPLPAPVSKFLILFPKKPAPKRFYIFLKNVFLIFREMKLSNPKAKNVLIFSQKKLFIYFEKWYFLKTLLYFRRKLSELEK